MEYMFMETIFYAGDSTVTFNKFNKYPQTGLSQALLLYVKDSVTVKSLAKNGRSTKSFLEEGLLKPAEERMKKGDFLFVQFGHNDEKEDPMRHTDPDTTFQDNLRYFIKAAKDRGAYPVLITPIARRHFGEDGEFLPGSHGEYPAAVKKTGREEGVPVIDLTTITERYLAEAGDMASKAYFMWPGDNTHLKPEGAVLFAGFLCRELKKLGSPYADIIFEDKEPEENKGLDVS